MSKKKKAKAGRPSLGLEKQALVLRMTPAQRKKLKGIVTGGKSKSMGGAVRWLIDRHK